MNHILLASHGTEGARAAEKKVLEMCKEGIRVTHLLVVPDFWKDMLGDDWLNNYSTRKRFEGYLEKELSDEVEGNIRRVQDMLAKSGTAVTHKVVMGKPDRCLLDACKKTTFDLVVMGSPRPKGSTGLHSRMTTRHVVRQLKTPQFAVPHPSG